MANNKTVYETYTGTTGSRYRLYLEISTTSQNYGANTSNVRVVCRMATTDNFGWFDFTNQTGYIRINGVQHNFNSNYPSSGTQTFITETDVISHDSDGRKTITISGYHNANQGSGLGTSTPSTTYTLDRIPQEPDVSSTSASNVQPNQATVGGNVTNSNGATITQRGIYYSTSDTTPDANDSVKSVSGTTGSFSTTLTGLQPNTKYYYRAFAKNSQGIGVGVVKSFTTFVTPFASVIYSNANPYADGKLMRDTGSGWSDVTSGDIYFKTFSEQGATTIAQNSLDPSQIIRNILDFASELGSPITYDSSSLEDTGTTVSYTFVSQTCYEAIKTALTLAPYDWYWYIDPSDNKFHFHQKSSIADHKLTFRKDVRSLIAEKKADDIVNTVFFTGGDTGGGSVLYKKYQDASSIGIYGEKDAKIIDQRVTDATTAELISTGLLERKSTPEVRLKTLVSDSNADRNGYDIESISIGDTMSVKNIKVSTAIPLDINDQIVQIVRKEYKPDSLMLICSTIPPEVTKRIEDIKRNLEDSITINNPDTPS